MRFFALFLSLLLNPLPAQPLSLFNGKDLSGWKVVPAESDFTHWRVCDGILICQSGPQRKGSMLWTQKDYGDYILTLQYRYGPGSIDSGVILRGEGDQIQIGVSASRQRDLTSSPYIPSKGYPVEATAAIKAQKLDDWNTLRIEVRGPIYRTWINGVEGVTYHSDTAKPVGPIGLQLHNNNEMEIHFRNLQLEELRKPTQEQPRESGATKTTNP